MLIGFAGKSGVGKTTYASELHKQLNLLGCRSELYSFATTLKRELSSIVYQYLHNSLDDTVLRSIVSKYDYPSIDRVDSFYDLLKSDEKHKYRRLMQDYGDYRRGIDEDYFVMKLDEIITGKTGYVIIDDVRFQNEIEYIKSRNGITIYVVSSRDISSDTHASESLDVYMYSWDYIIYNDFRSNTIPSVVNRVIGDIIFYDE